MEQIQLFNALRDRAQYDPDLNVKTMMVKHAKGRGFIRLPGLFVWHTVTGEQVVIGFNAGKPCEKGMETREIHAYVGRKDYVPANIAQVIHSIVGPEPALPIEILSRERPRLSPPDLQPR